MKEKKVIFIGTPVFAVPVLQALIENANVIAVVSQPNKEVGRKKVVVDTPIATIAKDNNILLMQPVKIKEITNEIKKLNPDMIVTCAYGQIIPEDILNIPEYGCINVHGSLLPKLRGGAPIQRAIINGEEKTGITIMYMDKGMDTGDMISKKEIEIEEEDNEETLSNKMSSLGAKLLIDTLPSIFDGTNKRESQDDTLATFAPIIKKEDELLDFNKTSREVYNQIRGLSPVPGAYFIMDNKRIKVYNSYIGEGKGKKPSTISNIYKDGFAIATIDSEIVITELQVEGKKRMDGKSYLNGLNKDNMLNKRIN